MNLENILLNRETGHQIASEIARWIGDDTKRMQQLMQIFLFGDHCITQRAAYPLMFIADRNPDLFMPYLKSMTDNLTDDRHDAVIRNTLRLFQHVEVPESIEGELFDKCIAYLSNPKYPVAIRVFAMTILTNFSLKYPELKAEVQPLIEDILEITESPGLHSRGKKMLTRLKTVPDEEGG